MSLCFRFLSCYWHIADSVWLFAFDWVQKRHHNTGDEALGTQLDVSLSPLPPLSHISQLSGGNVALFPTWNEGMVDRVQLLFTCNGGQLNPLRLPEGWRRRRRLKEIRALTKRRKDIIPFVLVELIPCEVKVLLLSALFEGDENRICWQLPFNHSCRWKW